MVLTSEIGGYLPYKAHMQHLRKGNHSTGSDSNISTVKRRRFGVQVVRYQMQMRPSGGYGALWSIIGGEWRARRDSNS